MNKFQLWRGPLLLALSGCAVLLALGMWQVQRLGWKEELIATLETKLAGEAENFPPAEFENYAPVFFSGVPVGDAFHILTVAEGLGQGYRVVQAFENDDARVLVDAGFIGEAQKEDQLFEARRYDFVGNLYIPEATLKTPPDLERNIWIDYDIDKMSEMTGSAPLFIIAREGVTSMITPLPLTSNLPNNHAQYAVTWFSLAAIWLIMSVYWGVARQRGKKDE